MEGTRPQDHHHAPGPAHETAPGEILIPALLFASASPESEVVGKVERGEKVRILARSRPGDSRRVEWFLVRKKNRDEGWLREDHLRELPVERQVFIVPARGPLSSRFGYRVHPVTKKKYSFHRGIDIAAPEGSPVRASATGKVIRSEFNRNGYGNLVVIQHEKDLTTWYGHLEKRAVRRGDSVRQGDLLGTVGSTGRTTGPHLHFEVRRGNKALDPEAWIH
jgi:murein DD-endopeptidase MepM/ murein hydrolase activator NlpD